MPVRLCHYNRKSAPEMPVHVSLQEAGALRDKPAQPVSLGHGPPGQMPCDLKFARHCLLYVSRRHRVIGHIAGDRRSLAGVLLFELHNMSNSNLMQQANWCSRAANAVRRVLSELHGFAGFVKVAEELRNVCLVDALAVQMPQSAEAASLSLPYYNQDPSDQCFAQSQLVQNPHAEFHAPASERCWQLTALETAATDGETRQH
ncbi:hypothetical protein AK812_SmicGene42707 [Symbiodinium microadriaticum]|uniref:Uncharacterized protein n=1 Tax=Symbiodinium microadriaticum TaxID=2951 RepID=A0A1Q9C2W0_SYMMI|nr:hypothetical protein AK812_SmicGene42707 [Symbiodinium microadriaticum]